MSMDEELKALARHALVEAFWLDFSDLCNRYVAMSEGLDVDLVRMQMQEHASVYGVDEAHKGDHFINLYVVRSSGYETGYYSMVEALEDPDAQQVYLQGECVFHRRGGEWVYGESGE